ncbi:hypothetical protein FOXYSP1_00226 [Fusarium oxysporum f. sp. phaseoli]
MVPPASALDPTGYMPIETVADARAVVTQCIDGLLKLVPRGPDDREAAQFLRQNATFVFEVLDQVSGPPAWSEASEPTFCITDIPSDTRVGLRRKSITILVNGRRYCVIVICSSQNLTNPDLQPRYDNQYGRPDSPLSWPSELILPEFSTSLETCKTNLEASLAEMWRDCYIFPTTLHTTIPPGFALSGAARGVMRKSVSLAIPSPLKSTEASRPTARSHQTEHDFGRHYPAWLVPDECNVNPDCRMVIVIEKTQRRAAQAITECLALVSFIVFRYFERFEFPSLVRQMFVELGSLLHRKNSSRKVEEKRFYEV